MDENDFRHVYDIYFKNANLKVSWYQLFSKFSTTARHIDNGIWRLQLKILRTWINIRVYSFLDKYDDMKIGLLVAQKIRTYSLKNIAPRHFTYYYILLFLWNKSTFQIQPSGDRKIFSTTCLPFYLLILCVSWSSSSVSKLFYK